MRNSNSKSSSIRHSSRRPLQWTVVLLLTMTAAPQQYALRSSTKSITNVSARGYVPPFAFLTSISVSVPLPHSPLLATWSSSTTLSLTLYILKEVYYLYIVSDDQKNEDNAPKNISLLWWFHFSFFFGFLFILLLRCLHDIILRIFFLSYILKIIK